MLNESFTFLENVGGKKEVKIKEQVRDWNGFLNQNKINGLSDTNKIRCNEQILKAKQALINNNASFFINFPEPIKLFNFFKDECVYLDIETTGYYGDITVIGLYDGYETKMMIKGYNLNKEVIKNELQKYKMIVTFNGASFDLPVIKKYFGADVIPEVPHLDLRFACAKIGLKGGLKKIEKKLGISRSNEVNSMSGADAVNLWNQFQTTGNKKYLKLLIKYNQEDIINLKTIANIVYDKLKR